MYACYKLNSLICDIDKLKKYFFYNKKENLKSLVSSFKTIFSTQKIELKVDFKKYFNFNRLNKNNYFKNKLQKEKKYNNIFKSSSLNKRWIWSDIKKS